VTQPRRHWINLTALGASPREFFPLPQARVVSVEIENPEGATLNDGEIEIRVHNSLDSAGASVATITAPGLTQLDTEDWGRALYLSIAASAAASTPTEVLATFWLG